MKLDEIRFSSEKSSQYFPILFVFCISFSVLLCVGFVPYRVTNNSVVLSECDKVEVFAVEIAF